MDESVMGEDSLKFHFKLNNLWTNSRKCITSLLPDFSEAGSVCWQSRWFFPVIKQLYYFPVYQDHTQFLAHFLGTLSVCLHNNI